MQVIFGLSAIVFLALFLSTAMVSWTGEDGHENDFNSIEKWFSGINTGLFFIAAVAYPIVGYSFYYHLRKFCPEKAHKMKVRVIWSVVLISIPLLIRSIYNALSPLIKEFEEFEKNGIENNDIRFSIFAVAYLTLTEFIPIMSQIVLITIVLHHFRRKYGHHSQKSPKNYSWIHPPSSTGTDDSRYASHFMIFFTSKFCSNFLFLPIPPTYLSFYREMATEYVNNLSSQLLLDEDPPESEYESFVNPRSSYFSNGSSLQHREYLEPSQDTMSPN